MKKYLFSAVFIFLFSPWVYASVTGKASFSGTAPVPEKLDVKSDPACGSGGEVFSEQAVVNSNGTLKNVFVYVKEGLDAAQTFEVPLDKVVLDQKGCKYTPHVFGVQVGQPVEILNSDATLHNVHGMPKQSKEFNLGMPIQGMKITRKFDTPEVMVKFKCDVHPWMSAYAGILPHPFFAVTGEDGSFEIKNLPAGNYVLEAWHEKFGVQTQNVTVGDDGTAAAEFSFAG
jgi:plastocyanin